MTAVDMDRKSKEMSKTYFGKYIKILKIFGVSLTGDESFSYLIYSFLFLISTAYMYAALDFYELFKHDFKTSSNILIYETAVVMTVFKIAMVLINREKFGKLLAKLEQKPFLPNKERGGDEEEKLIHECMWKINVQTCIYWVSITMNLLGNAGYSCIKRLKSSDHQEWYFPWGPLTVLNVTYSPNYEISWVYQNVSFAVVAVHFSTIDLLTSAVLAHTSYQFKILQHYLRNMVKHSYDEMLEEKATKIKGQPHQIHNAINDSMANFNPEIHSSTIPWKYLQKSLKDAVRYHIAIIDIAKEMEKLFRYLHLGTFLLVMGVLCFSMYKALFQHTMVGLLRNVYTACAFQVIMVCYWGEEVMFQSQKVGIAAYESNFVGSDLRFQKALVLINRRSQNSTKLTVGKFTNISLYTFAWIIRASYSMFMVIRNNGNGKKI